METSVGKRYTIKELPPDLRPRERMLAVGPEALSNDELMGILFGIGTREKTAVELASEVIAESGGLYGMHNISQHELLQIKGIGEAKTCIILAAIEFGKRLGRVRNPGKPVISSPSDVDGLLRGRIASQDRENFVAVLLDMKNQVIDSPVISVGTLSSSLVHPREVFKPAIRASAASVILSHNHPSGRVEPSREDREVTKRLVSAAGIIGIEVLDHVIIGDEFFSMKEHGML